MIATKYVKKTVLALSMELILLIVCVGYMAFVATTQGGEDNYQLRIPLFATYILLTTLLTHMLCILRRKEELAIISTVEVIIGILLAVQYKYLSTLWLDNTKIMVGIILLLPIIQVFLIPKWVKWYKEWYKDVNN